MQEIKTKRLIEVEAFTSTTHQQNDDGKWCCDVCGSVHDSQEDLLTHRILHLSNRHSKECPICGKSFSSSSTLRNHLTVHTGIKKYRCKYCSRRFGWKTQLAIHENVHTGKGLHHCDICSKSFMTKWLLQRHSKIHNKTGISRVRKENKRNYSTQDPTLFLNKLNLDRNIINNDICEISCTSQDGINHQCRECGKSYGSKETLAFHLLSHNTSKQQQNKTMDDDEISQLSSSRNLSHCQNATQYSKKDDEAVEIENRSKLNIVKQPSKGSLTSIVSKLHHKVDEKQKCDSEDTIRTEEHVMRSISLATHADEENSSRVELNNDFTMDILSKQAMVKSADPFISGMSAESDFTQENFHRICHQVRKQNKHIDGIRVEFQRFKSEHSKELSSLHAKIDCLTNLVSSQSLILNKLILGGKMNVSGILDFSVQPSHD